MNPVPLPPSSTVNCTNSPSFRKLYIPEYDCPSFAPAEEGWDLFACFSVEVWASCARRSADVHHIPNPINPQIRKDGNVFIMNSRPAHIVLPRRARDQVHVYEGRLNDAERCDPQL